MNMFKLKADIKALEGGRFEVIASTEDTDRMGDKILATGWYLDNWFKNPVFLWAHDHTLPPVARGIDKMAWIEDGKLKASGLFAPTEMGQQTRILVENMFLNTTSVGFYPLVNDEEKGNIKIEEKMWRRATDEEIQKAISDKEKGLYPNDGFVFEKQELLEISWVNVPALPQALVTARKMNLPLMVKMLEDIEKQEKSPACRITDETQEECRARKIPELLDEGMEQDQAVAAAINICKEPCKEKSFEKSGRVLSEKNRGLIKNCIDQMDEAIDALTELHDATEPEKDISPSHRVNNKGRKTGNRTKRRNPKLIILQSIDKSIEKLIIEAKKE